MKSFKTQTILERVDFADYYLLLILVYAQYAFTQ